MNSRQELKILRRLSQLLENDQQEAKKRTMKRKAIYAVTWLALVSAFMLVMNREPIGIVAVSMAAFAGIFAGLAIFSGVAADQWPIVKPHINSESIKERLKQLET
jgi:hypothetical protein